MAESRLERLPDGRYAYRPKRGRPFVLEAAALLRRRLALVPLKGFHLTRLRGVFAAASIEAAAAGGVAGGGLRERACSDRARACDLVTGEAAAAGLAVADLRE